MKKRKKQQPLRLPGFPPVRPEHRRPVESWKAVHSLRHGWYLVHTIDYAGCKDCRIEAEIFDMPVGTLKPVRGC